MHTLAQVVGRKFEMLAVDKQTHPVWHDRLVSHGPKVIELVVDRCVRQFLANIAAMLKKQRSKRGRLNLTNPTHLAKLRSYNAETCYAASAVWLAFVDDMDSILTPAKKALLEKTFFRGELDEELIEKAKLKNDSFVSKDFLFLRGYQATSDALKLVAQVDDVKTVAATEAREEAELGEFKQGLLKESIIFEAWLVKKLRAKDATEVETITQNEVINVRRKEQATLIANENFYFAPLLSDEKVTNYINESHVDWCSGRSVDGSHVRRLYIFNATYSGMAHDYFTSPAFRIVNDDMSLNPTSRAFLVIMPNTGGGPGDTLLDSKLAVRAACRRVEDDLSRAEFEFEVAEGQFQFTDESLSRSTSRAASHKFLFAISNKTDTGNKLVSDFAKSRIFLRGAPSEKIVAHPFAQFYDLTSKQQRATDAMSIQQRLKQHITGAPMWAAFIRDACSALPKASAAVEIVDMNLYDPTLASACFDFMHQNNRPFQRICVISPIWTLSKNHAERLEENVKDHLVLHIQKHMKNMEPQRKPSSSVAMPELDLEQFKICKVCADDALRIMKPVNDHMVERLPTKIEEFMQAKEEHNKKFNPTGQLWSEDSPAPKRARDDAGEGDPPEKPETPADTNTKDLIKKKYPSQRLKIATSEAGDYEILCGLDENGSPEEVFLYGLRSSVVGDATPIALSHGRFFLDQEVPAGKEKDVLPYKVESEEYVASFKSTSKDLDG
jgi:hypothetical protein